MSVSWSHEHDLLSYIVVPFLLAECSGDRCCTPRGEDEGSIDEELLRDRTLPGWRTERERLNVLEEGDLAMAAAASCIYALS